MRSQDSKTFLAITATTAVFNIQGGYYAFMQNGDTYTSSNHVDVQMQGPDGSTNYITAIAGVQTGTSGYTLGYLPPGQCRIAVTGTLTATNVALTRVPFD